MPDTLRGEVEERMTKAVIRECNICHTELSRIGGCNTVKCSCGNIMCYVCRETISPNKFHFCICDFNRRADREIRCSICKLCRMITDLVEVNDALDAKEEALKELADKEPKLLDMEIGPPIKRTRLP